MRWLIHDEVLYFVARLHYLRLGIVVAGAIPSTPSVVFILPPYQLVMRNMQALYRDRQLDVLKVQIVLQKLGGMRQFQKVLMLLIRFEKIM